MATLDITRSIDINAPADKVWAAITEPDLIAQWFGETCEFDPTPGEPARSAGPQHGTFRVVVEHVDPPKTLIYRWARESDVDPVPGNSTVVRFDLTEVAGGTRLTLLETGFDDCPIRRARTTTTSADGGPNSASSWSSWNPGDRRLRDDAGGALGARRRDPLADSRRDRRHGPVRQCVGRPAARQQAGHRQAPRRARRGRPGGVCPRRTRDPVPRARRAPECAGQRTRGDRQTLGPAPRGHQAHRRTGRIERYSFGHERRARRSVAT